MTRFRVYTENVNREWLKELFSRYYDGYTVFEGLGVWQSVPENSIVFELVDGASAIVTLRAIANQIKAENNQKAVLITSEAVTSEII